MTDDQSGGGFPRGGQEMRDLAARVALIEGYLDSITQPEPDPADELALWVWRDMTPSERDDRVDQLDQWVRWLVVSHSLEDVVPPCWAQHPGIREHLTVLHQAWNAIHDEPGRPAGEALHWLVDLEYLRPRLTNGCATSGYHQPQRTVKWPAGAPGEAAVSWRWSWPDRETWPDNDGEPPDGDLPQDPGSLWP